MSGPQLTVLDVVVPGATLSSPTLFILALFMFLYSRAPEEAVCGYEERSIRQYVFAHHQAVNVRVNEDSGLIF